MSVNNVGKRILVIDDEPQILYLMKVFLEDAGFEVLVCNNPNEIVSVINNEKIDAVVCDFLMPQLNGLECIQAIRKETGLDIPVIIATAVHNIDIQKVVEAGGNDLVRKPIDFIKLATILDRELSQLKLAKSKSFDNLDLTVFMLENNGFKLPLKLTQLSLNQLYFELPKDKCQLKSSRFFEIFIKNQTEEMHFPFKGEVSQIISLNSMVDLIVVDLKIYDFDSYEKLQKIYKERQEDISNFLKSLKDL